MGHVACLGKLRKCYKISVEELEGRKLLRRNRKRLEGNIKIDVKYVQGTDLPSPVQNTVKWQVLVNMATDLPSSIQRVANFLTDLLHVIFDPWNIEHN